MINFQNQDPIVCALSKFRLFSANLYKIGAQRCSFLWINVPAKGLERERRGWDKEREEIGKGGDYCKCNAAPKFVITIGRRGE